MKSAACGILQRNCFRDKGRKPPSRSQAAYRPRLRIHGAVDTSGMTHNRQRSLGDSAYTAVQSDNGESSVKGEICEANLIFSKSFDCSPRSPKPETPRRRHTVGLRSRGSSESSSNSPSIFHEYSRPGSPITVKNSHSPLPGTLLSPAPRKKAVSGTRRAALNDAVKMIEEDFETFDYSGGCAPMTCTLPFPNSAIAVALTGVPEDEIAAVTLRLSEILSLSEWQSDPYHHKPWQPSSYKRGSAERAKASVRPPAGTEFSEDVGCFSHFLQCGRPLQEPHVGGGKEEQTKREEQFAREQSLRREERYNKKIRLWDDVLPVFRDYKNDPRVHALWREGLPLSVRGYIWPRAIGNDLSVRPHWPVKLPCTVTRNTKLAGHPLCTEPAACCCGRAVCTLALAIAYPPHAGRAVHITSGLLLTTWQCSVTKDLFQIKAAEAEAYKKGKRAKRAEAAFLEETAQAAQREMALKDAADEAVRLTRRAWENATRLAEASDSIKKLVPRILANRPNAKCGECVTVSQQLHELAGYLAAKGVDLEEHKAAVAAAERVAVESDAMAKAAMVQASEAFKVPTPAFTSHLLPTYPAFLIYPLNHPFARSLLAPTPC
ncbi:hypothetical protein CYMTET_11492 [Cymbomonas tetramitiformis]|uniref:Uncharacterized protein n=1 Tax=Cymbomonas tetramitiformis TaxID=36881 RepID=A0AAE0LD43_9CHLO|nr:hypothetical protein CYMTET_11492 [Cymbomonas tetramitiformis]